MRQLGIDGSKVYKLIDGPRGKQKEWLMQDNNQVARTCQAMKMEHLTTG